LARLERTFGPEPEAKDFSFPEFPKRQAPTEARTANLSSQHDNTAMLIVSYPTTSILDTASRDAVEVLDSVLTGGGGAGGRLFNELRGERLVYYVFGHEIVGLAPGFFLFMAQTLPETADEVIRRIQDNLREIAESGMEEAEFELAKQKLIAGHAMRNTTPGSQAFQAAVFELYGLGFDHDDDYEERIRQVQLEDVQTAVRQFFQQPIIVTTMPDKEREQPE